MATRALVKVLDPFLTWAAVRYQAAVGDVLRKHGLRYEDLYDPDLNMMTIVNSGGLPLISEDVDEALKRLPQDEVDARTQRLKRAMDLSLKHVYLPKELQAVQTPFNSYVMDVIQQVEAENQEKAQLGTGKTYDRSIP